jgi:hypothetical protein
LIPAIEIEEEVVQAWMEVGAVKWPSVELYLRDQDVDYDGFRLIK